MKNIVLLCNARLSTGVLVAKLREEAKLKGVDYTINSSAISEVKECCENADLVLLAPQIGYELDNIKEMVSCPVFIIDRTNYSMVQSDKIFEFIMDKLNK